MSDKLSNYAALAQSPAHILVVKACQDLDFPEGALTVGLVFKRTDLLYCNLGHTLVVESRAAGIEPEKDHQ